MIFRTILCFVALYLLSGCGTAHNYDAETVLRLEPGPGNPRNSEGDFIRLANGNILFVYTYFTAGSGDHANAYLASRVSVDDGRTWSAEDAIVVKNEGGMNVMSVSLLRLLDGRIAMFYLRKDSESMCIPYMRVSTDEAQHWSDPVRCISENGYYVLNNDRVIQLPTGRILLPVSLHNTPETNQFQMNGQISCYYSDDSGVTWQESSEVPNPDRVTLQEPGIVLQPDDRIMMFCRSGAGTQFLSYSNDHGLTWSAVKAGPFRSPRSPASIEQMPSTGDLLVVWNDNYEPDSRGGKRTPLTVAVSGPESLELQNIRNLEDNPHGWYCYTAIEFLEDAVLLAYCAGDTRDGSGLATTQITRLTTNWIYRAGN